MHQVTAIIIAHVSEEAQMKGLHSMQIHHCVLCCALFRSPCCCVVLFYMVIHRGSSNVQSEQQQVMRLLHHAHIPATSLTIHILPSNPQFLQSVSERRTIYTDSRSLSLSASSILGTSVISPFPYAASMTIRP